MVNGKVDDRRPPLKNVSRLTNLRLLKCVSRG